jgi:hypothetical protein
MGTVTYGWLVYRMKAGEPQFMGLHQTREKAVADIEVLAGTAMAEGWKVERILFIGWGMAAPGVFSQNGKPPLKLVE